MSLSSAYFEQMYRNAPDPWGFADRWYEERKRAVTMAALPDPRYATAYEPGCSIGVLTAALADRCGALLSTDVSETALGIAGKRLAGRANVRFERRAMPDEWPEGHFDLVVVSEVLYYLDDVDLALAVTRATGAVTPGGSLVAVHWRHPVADYPQHGDAVQAALAAAAARYGLVRTVHHVEADFDLAVHVRRDAGDSAGTMSVAGRTGLC